MTVPLEKVAFLGEITQKLIKLRGISSSLLKITGEFYSAAKYSPTLGCDWQKSSSG
jgi:hypothetical protein